MVNRSDESRPWHYWVIPHIVGAIVSVGICVPIIWMFYDREPPYIMTGGTISPANPAPGDPITVQWDIETRKACPSSPNATVSREIVDSKGVKHLYATVHAIFDSKETETEIVRHLHLPVSIAPGRAYYSSVTCYSCNPVQEFWPICMKTPEIYFNVAPPKDPF